jgi:uncharacterized protein (TIGR00369 family)
VNTEPATIAMKSVRHREHGNCVVCGRASEYGFGVEYVVSDDGVVQASFGCEKAFEGFQNVIHGGVISLLIDGAMTNCVFSHGYVAVTAELTVRFQRPVKTGVPAIVRAWVDKSYRPLHLLKAEVIQDRVVKATAEGKFMERPEE